MTWSDRKLIELSKEEFMLADTVEDSPGHFRLELPNAFGVEYFDLGPTERQMTLSRLTGRPPDEFIP